MNLLAAKNYDPAAAVSKATSALLAMTAFDTTNLRLAITVPAHGMVRFRLQCSLEGATTFPAILLGVLNGATVVGRQSPLGAPDGTALATTFTPQVADFIATGLTPGAMNVDAAYGVETVVAATNIKYGGPNNTTANDAFGGFAFEAWDPQSQTVNTILAVDANGRVDVGKVLGTAQTAGDLKASMNTLQTDTDDIQTRIPAALTGGKMESNVGTMTANVLTAAAINAAALNGKGDWNIGKTGYALSAAGVQAIWDALTSALTTVGSIGKLIVDNLNATISSRMATFSLPANFSALSITAGGLVDITQTAADKVWSTAARTLTSFGTLIADIWANATRTLTAFGFSVTVGTNNDKTGYALTASDHIVGADAMLDRDMATGTDSGSPTVRTVRQALRMLRNKASITAGTLTVTKEDDTAASWTAAVTTAAGNPISAIDPA